MIGRLHGTLMAVAPPQVLIDVRGVGYEVDVPLSLLADLPPVGQAVTLITHLQVSDTAQSLYGFLHPSQRELFRKLMKVSGIGARLALAILSGIEPDRLANTILAGDVQALTRIPGVGKKTAERLLMELRDQLLPGAHDAVTGLPVRLPNAQAEASSALQQLGYKPQEADRIIKTVASDDMSTEALIRAALQALGSR